MIAGIDAVRMNAPLVRIARVPRLNARERTLLSTLYAMVGRRHQFVRVSLRALRVEERRVAGARTMMSLAAVRAGLQKFLKRLWIERGAGQRWWVQFSRWGQQRATRRVGNKRVARYLQLVPKTASERHYEVPCNLCDVNAPRPQVVENQGVRSEIRPYKKYPRTLEVKVDVSSDSQRDQIVRRFEMGRREGVRGRGCASRTRPAAPCVVPTQTSQVSISLSPNPTPASTTKLPRKKNSMALDIRQMVDPEAWVLLIKQYGRRHWHFEPVFSRMNPRTKAYWKHFAVALDGTPLTEYLDWLTEHETINPSKPMARFFTPSCAALIRFQQEKSRVVNEQNAPMLEVATAFCRRWPDTKKHPGLLSKLEEVVTERLRSGVTVKTLREQIENYSGASPLPWVVFAAVVESRGDKKIRAQNEEIAGIHWRADYLRKHGIMRYFVDSNYMIEGGAFPFADVYELVHGKKFDVSCLTEEEYVVWFEKVASEKTAQ